MTMALILAVPRRLSEGERLLRGGDWQGWAPTTMLGHRIWGKRLGIIGMGRIGQAVARRARGFGLSIHYHNRNRLDDETEAELEATWWQSLDQMLAHMDFVRSTARARRPPITCCRPGGSACCARSLRHQHLAWPRDRRGGPRAPARGRQDRGRRARRVRERAVVTPKLLTLGQRGGAPAHRSATIEGRRDMGEKVLINIQTFADGHNPPRPGHRSGGLRQVPTGRKRR